MEEDGSCSRGSFRSGSLITFELSGDVDSNTKSADMSL